MKKKSVFWIVHKSLPKKRQERTFTMEFFGMDDGPLSKIILVV